MSHLAPFFFCEGLLKTLVANEGLRWVLCRSSEVLSVVLFDLHINVVLQATTFVTFAYSCCSNFSACLSVTVPLACCTLFLDRCLFPAFFRSSTITSHGSIVPEAMAARIDVDRNLPIQKASAVFSSEDPHSSLLFNFCLHSNHPGSIFALNSFLVT